MDARVRTLAGRQADVLARWQLEDEGWTAGKIDHHVRRHEWRLIHPGVYLLNHAPPSRRQLWFAAALTTRDSVLSHGSAGACYGFYRFDRGYEVVTPPGTGGRRRHGLLVVCRSRMLQPDLTRHGGIPITTAARVLVDLARGLDRKRMGRAFRESIRLGHTSARQVRRTLERHPARRGTRVLRMLATRYATIPYRRTRSDAEGLALEILHDAGRPTPLVNVSIGDEEADLVFMDARAIVEIDGPQFHRFREEDLRKEAVWRKAGFVVRRIPSDAVYDAPEALLDICPE